MKRLLVTMLIVIALAVTWLLSPWGPLPLATLMSANDCLGTTRMALPPLYEEGEKALRQDHIEKARMLCRQGKQEARDSDEYYRFVVLDAKCQFYAMQADSFLLLHHQLQQYLSKFDSKSIAQQMLEEEQELQAGVYFAKFVGQMDSAQAHYQKAFDIARQLPTEASDYVLIYSNIADAYKQMGVYDQSIAFYHLAMESGEANGMTKASQITMTLGIASAYSAMRSFKESQEWWEQAALLESEMNKEERFHFLNNRGNDYFLQEKYEQSLDCFIRLDKLIANDPDMLWERMFGRCNLSGVLIKLGRIDEARPILEEAERFFTEKQQLLPLYYLTTQRIEMALNEGKLKETQQLIDHHQTPEWMIPEQIVLRQEVLMRYYEQTNQWQLLAKTMRAYYNLKDSIAGDNMKMRFSEATKRYQHVRQTLEKQRQLDQKEASIRRMIILFTGSVILSVLLIIIITMKLREQRLKGVMMENQIACLRMETVRNRITPHFIGNALSAEMLAQAEGREVNLDGIVELLHRGVEITGTELATLREELEFIDFYCAIESRSVGPDFVYQTQIADDVDASRVMLPSMSVQIMVENAIKHGLKRKKTEPGKERKVVVKATRQGQATLVEVIDNGVGLPDQQKITERTGLKVLRQTFTMLNSQNKNQISHDMENWYEDGQIAGCRAWILLPDEYDYKLKT